MRAILGLLSGIVLTVLVVTGCGPALSEEDLGTVVFEMSEVPGADESYPFPDSDAASESDSPDEPADNNS